MQFIKRIEVGKDFFAPKYLALHTHSFRRLSADNKFVGDNCYHAWQFSSNKIHIGCALIPPSKADHILLFSIEKHEDIDSVTRRINNYLLVNNTLIDEIRPGQSLYVTFEKWDQLIDNK